MASAAALSLKYVWGGNSGSATGVEYVDASNIVYVCGHTVVVQNVESGAQKFIPGSTEEEGFSCVAVCPGKKFVAAAEKGSERGSVVVYDARTLRKRKVLTQSQAACVSYASVCFSADSDSVMALTSFSAATLIAWRWGKGKLTASLRLETDFSRYSGLGYSPVVGDDAPQFVSVCGDAGVAFVRVEPDALAIEPVSKELGLDDDETIACHKWLSTTGGYCAAGTSEGRIVVYSGSSVLCHLAARVGIDGARGVRCMASSKQGFVAVSAAGIVHFFEKKGDGAELFVETRTLNLTTEDRPSPLASVTSTHTNASGTQDASPTLSSSYGGACSASSSVVQREPPKGAVWCCLRPTPEDALICQTADNQMYVVNLARRLLKGAAAAGAGATTTTTTTTATTATSDESPSTAELWAAGLSLHLEAIKPVHASYHSGAVTGLDTCKRKPIAVSVGADRTLRIWNYLKNKQDLVKTLADDPLSVSVHPTGLHCAVGFSDKLRLMHILVDDVRTFREIPIKACREVRFAHGGHCYAAVNGAAVAVYEFYPNNKPYELRGHNSKVKAVAWSRNDHTLVTCGQDGAVYLWDWLEGKRTGEFVQKGTTYHSAVCTSEAVFALGSDRLLRELERPELQPAKQLDNGGSVLTGLTLTHSEHLMFAGSTAERTPGLVRAYSYPLTGDFMEFASVGGPITRIRMSPDDKVLIVASEDGLVCAFDVKPNPASSSVLTSAQKTDQGETVCADDGKERLMQWSDEVLVSKGDLEEMEMNKQELKNKIEELKLQNEYQLRLKEMAHSEKIKEVTEKYMQDIEQQKNKYELLREEKNDLQMEYEERYRQMEDAHRHELQELENQYQEKLMAEVEKYQQLEREHELEKQRSEAQHKDLLATHEAYVTELKEDLEHKLEEERQARMALEEEVAQSEREYAEIKKQLEEDVDTEIQNLRHRYETQLAAERDATLRYKGENGIMKKKFSVLTKEIEDQKEEIKTLLGREKELQEQVKKLEREIRAHKVEIKKRDDTIAGKEKKIYELKKKNQELEKFKFVLDYKIKELKRQIEPRETEIANMKQQIKSMDQELEQYHRSNAQLDLMIGELRSKIDAMQKEILDYRKKNGDVLTKIKKIKADIQDCVDSIQDPDELKSKVEKLYERHKLSPEQQAQQHQIREPADPAVVAEYERHEASLRQSLETLQAQFQKDVKKHSEENMRIMNNNMGLIQEINAQREANRILTLDVQALEAKLQNDKALSSGKNANKGSKAKSSAETQSPPDPPPAVNNDDRDRVDRDLTPEQLEQIQAMEARIADLELQCRDRGIDPDQIPWPETEEQLQDFLQNAGVFPDAPTFSPPSVLSPQNNDDDNMVPGLPVSAGDPAKAAAAAIDLGFERPVSPVVGPSAENTADANQASSSSSHPTVKVPSSV